jgi:predicted acetyltransferase
MVDSLEVYPVTYIGAASAMDIEISPASYQEKEVLRNLLELYSYDFSVIEEGEASDVNEFGLFGYRYLDHYWTEAGRAAYLVRVNGVLAGFALLRRASYLPEPEGQLDEAPMTIAEFFILRKYRRRGFGRSVATYLFDRFPGRWQVAQVAGHHEAQTFWRQVIGEFTAGKFQEVQLESEVWKGPVQFFDTSGK